MRSRKNLGRVGLAVMVLAAGAVAVVANLGILDTGQASEEIGVITATDLRNAPPSTTETSTSPPPTVLDAGAQATVEADADRHDDDGDHGDDDGHRGDRDKDRAGDHEDD